MTNLRDRAIEGIQVGDTFSVTRTFTETDVSRFAEMTRFAQAKGFNSRICHGLLVGSMFTEIGGQIGVLASTVDLVFKKPVFLGDTVTCQWTFTEIDERYRAKAQVEFRNQDGTLVLTAAVRGIVPGPPESAILKAMVEEGDPTNLLADRSAE